MAKKILFIILGLLIILVIFGFGIGGKKSKQEKREENKEIWEIALPAPLIEEGSFEGVILKRRSKREFKDKALSLEQVGQILWAGQGITDKEKGFRAAPSAGALYPLTLYLVVGKGGVEGLEEGVYWYEYREHKIEKKLGGDLRKDLALACAGQEWVGEASIIILIVADFEKTTKKYGERGKSYVFIEVGHVGQNILLEAVSLGLGAVPVGAFENEKVKRILDLAHLRQGFGGQGGNLEPLYVIPVGYAKE